MAKHTLKILSCLKMIWLKNLGDEENKLSNCSLKCVSNLEISKWEKARPMVPYMTFLAGSDLFIVTQHATQPRFTCSKSTIDTIEKGVKYFQS